MAEELGYYTLPVIASFDGIDKQVNSKLSKAFGVAGKQAGAEMAKGAGEGLKVLEVEVENATKSYQKLRDKAADALGKITVEEAKLAKARDAGKADQITAAEERLAKARRDSARATRDAEDGHKSLIDAQKRLGAGTDDLGGKFGKLSGLAGGAGTAMASAGALAGGAALAGIAALGAGVLTAGNRLYELGAQFDDLSDTLQTKTGLSGKALDDLKGSVEKLGTTDVPSSFAQIGDVAAEVTRNLHLTGKPLEDITSRLANLQRMGKDVDIRSFSKAVKGFGLDAQGQVGAINALNEISGKTGLSIDDMTGSLVTNGAALRTLGLDFADGAALVTTFEDAGLDADTMLKGLKKGSVEFAKDGKTASQGIHDTITELQNLIAAGDEVGAQNLANKVFGAKNGQNFFDAIKNGKLDLQSLSSSLSLTGLDINDVSANTADWSERWQLLKSDVELALEPLAGEVFDGVNEQLTQLADWVKGHKSEVIDFFTGIGDAAITGADFALDAVGQLAQGVGQFIEPFGDIEGAMLDFQAFQAKIRGDFDTERELKAQAQEAYGWGESLDKAGQSMRDFDPQALRDKLHDVAGDAKAAAGENDKLSTSIGGVGDSINKLPKELPTWFGPLATGTGPGQTTNPLDVIGGGPGSSVLPGGPLLAPNGTPLRPSGSGNGVGLNLQLAAANAANNEALWDRIAVPESSGNWQDNNSGNHSTSSGAPRGGLQITDGTWNAYGGPEFAPTANQATKEQQMEVANRIAFTGYKGTKPQGLGAWETVAKGMVPGVSVDTKPDPATSLSAALPPTGNLPDVRGAHEQLADVLALAQAQFPGLQLTAGRDDHSKDGGYHPRGEAIDIGGDPASMNALSNYLTQNFAPYLAEVIHKGAGVTQNVKDGKLTPAIDMPGSIYSTAQAGNHDDHVHIAIKDDMAAAFEQALGLAPGGSTTPLTLGSGSASGVSLLSAGTPGFNEYGEPGTYVTDPKAIRQAQQAIDDANERVKRADQAVAEAEARKAELDADASESQKLSAENALENAKADAARARREAEDAKTDAATTAQGKFTAAKEAKKSSSGKGGFDQFGGLGSIFGSALKETLGIDGSFFPDISNSMPMQMLNAGLNAFQGPLQGLVDGQLGIQQPGWQPGMPVNGVANDTGIGTSNAAFGMPDVAVPPMPPGDQHIGPGGPAAPGPVQNITVDQSVHGNVGSSPEELFKTRDQGLARAMPRMPNIR
ncbi:transglycosylase family protein [Mycolicibacterium sp. Y3]